MSRILITPRSATRAGHPALARLQAAGFELGFCRPGELPSEGELLELLPGCVGYLAGVEKVSARVLEAAAARGLRVISRNGTGADAIDLAAAERLGVKVLRAQGSNARGVAELALGLMLALARNLPATDRALKAGGWERFPGFELEGKTLGLLGCGQIGRLVAGFGLALGMRVLAYDPFPNWPEAPAGFAFAPMNEVLRDADIVSLHTPPRADGAPLFVPREMRRGAVLINTARAGLVSEEALLEALESGYLAGAGVDVFEPEPPVDRRLLEHPRVIALPHVGGYTPESIQRAMDQAVGNLLEALT